MRVRNNNNNKTGTFKVIATSNWKSCIYTLRWSGGQTFVSYFFSLIKKRMVQQRFAQRVYIFFAVSLFFNAIEPDFTVANSHMCLKQRHATQAYSAENQSSDGFRLNGKERLYNKVIDFEIFTRIQTWLECSQCLKQKIKSFY